MDFVHGVEHCQAFGRGRLESEEAQCMAQPKEHEQHRCDTVEQSRFHICSARARNSSSNPVQPCGESVALRMVSKPAPWRSKQRCSRSTRVEPSGSAVKRTSTSLDLARSGSYCHVGLTCQAITKRFGGSQARMLPQSH